MANPTCSGSRALGPGPPLSRLGLGAWAFGRTGWGAQHDHNSRAAILRAVELGVTWIDTAAVYGDGHSERIVGRTLAELSESDRPLIFTKGGVRIDRSSGTTFRDLRPASLRHECEASLRRLGVERIDVYQLHWPVDDPCVVQRAWEALGELQDEGKIQMIGVSNFDVPLLKRCAAMRPIATVQAPLSLLSRASGRELLPWADAHGVRVLAYSPLESGLLSGHFSLQRLRSLPEDDWRSEREHFRQPRLGRVLTLLESLGPIAADRGMSVAQLAIAWTLAWRAVAGVIVGARTAKQVDGWAGASRVPLDPAGLKEIEAALIATGAGSGPAHPLPDIEPPSETSIGS
jgi:aryl-alcohol dehydrogenase-like predicted oxidoreductase